MIFGTGPLAGTLAPSANRMSVTAKSWQYNGVGTSNVGGSFAPELKWAGYDHIVIHGKAQEPVYIYISDDEVELRPAGLLWGKCTWETDEMIKEALENPDVKLTSIGSAGEKLVKFAHVVDDLERMGKL